MTTEVVPSKPYKDKVEPRVEVRGDSMDIIDAGALVNSAFYITKRYFEQSDEEIIDLLKVESQAHDRATPGLILQSVEELTRRAEDPECRDYLEVVERTVRLMNEAGLLREENQDATY